MRISLVQNYGHFPKTNIKEIDCAKLQEFDLSFPEISKEYRLDWFLDKLNQFNSFIKNQNYELLEHVGRILEFEIENHFYWQEFVSICETIRYNMNNMAQFLKSHCVAKINAMITHFESVESDLNKKGVHVAEDEKFANTLGIPMKFWVE